MAVLMPDAVSIVTLIQRHRIPERYRAMHPLVDGIFRSEMRSLRHILSGRLCA